jgi:glycosyltransferase involved in cell wall biosynthesis
MLDPAQLTPYYNIALCDALALAGCQVRYITSQYLYDDNLPFTKNFQTDYLYFRGLNHPRLIHYPHLRRLLRGIYYPINHWQLLREIRQNPPDILHIQWSRLPRFDTWFVQQVRALGVPIVHTIHDITPLYAPDSKTDPLETVYKQVDRVILHTEANRRDFLQAYPSVNSECIRVIPHIAIPYNGTPSNASQAYARQLLHLPADMPVFLFFGSIRHYKGVDILLPAFAEALKANPDIHLVIAGLPETAEDRTLLDAATQLPNIQVHAGYIPYADLWQYYVATDIVVLPYRSITQSGALITAMEFGRAVVVTDIGGLPESIEGNGWIVPSENVNALTVSILEAASDMERVQKMGERSSVLIRQKYAGSAVADGTIRVYNELNGKP